MGNSCWMKNINYGVGKMRGRKEDYTLVNALKTHLSWQNLYPFFNHENNVPTLDSTVCPRSPDQSIFCCYKKEEEIITKYYNVIFLVISACLSMRGDKHIYRPGQLPDSPGCTKIDRTGISGYKSTIH